MAKTKRPYSLEYTAQGVPARYLLSGIPPTLWKKVRAQAKREGTAVRPLILRLLEQWLKGATESAASPRPGTHR
jgi:hypothetical protein